MPQAARQVEVEAGIPTTQAQPWWRPRTPEERAAHHEAVNLRRSVVLPVNVSHDTLFDKALRECFPWSIHDYPGYIRGAFVVLGKRAPNRTIRAWREGTRRAPLWAIDALCSYLRARGEAMIRAAAELEDSTKTHQRPPQGFCVVDPETGMDKRGGRVGRRKERELKAKDL